MEHRLENVVVETDRYRIEGKLTLPREGYRSRLSDYVNQRDRDFFAFQGAEYSMAIDGAELVMVPEVTAASDGLPPDDFVPHVGALVAHGRRSEAVKYFMRTVGVPGFGIAVMRLFPMWKTMRGVAHTLPYDARVMDGFAVPEERFARIRCPTVLAAGAKTTPTLKLAAQAVAKAVPGATYQEVPKSNHGIKGQAILPVLDAAFKSKGPKAAN